jgi:hypothetical protein
MALTSLTAKLIAGYQWTAQLNRSGAGYTPITVNDTITDTFQFGTSGLGAANTSNNVSTGQVSGSDELVASLVTLTASGGGTPSLSLNLTALNGAAGQPTDVCGQTVNFARVKAIRIQLLNTAQDPTNGTSCSSITIDNTVANALSAQSHSGWFDNAGEATTAGSKFTLTSGARLTYEAANAAGLVVDGTHKIIKLTNNDAVNAAAIRVVLIGGTVT